MTLVPGWWPFVLLALAAWRTWRLLAEDVILDLPRAELLGRAPDKLVDMWLCPWCLGWWVTLAWWGAWLAWPHATLIAATPFALNAAWARLHVPS